ncbi:MAG: SurA N-terminal domain-containing protein [Candidatus Andersenbacteria bacterium]
MNDEQSTPSSASGKRKWIIGLVGIALLAAVAYFAKNNPQSGPNDSSGAVAVVNGVEISRKTFEASLGQAQANQAEEVEAGQLEQQVLDGLIAEELLFQQAEAEGITANEELIQQQLDQVTGQFETTEAFQSELAAAQMTEEDLREAVTRGSVIQTYLERKIPADSIEVTAEEVQMQLDLVAPQLEGQEGVNLDEIRPVIEQQLQQQKRQQQITTLLEDLRAQGDIQILL